MWITQNKTVFGNEGENFNLFLEYTSGTPFLLSGEIPEGLIFDSSIGQIFGTLPIVNTTTTFPITFRLKSGSDVYDLAINIVVTNNTPIWVTEPQLSPQPQFEFIDLQLEVFDPRSTNITYSIIQGELPKSLNINPDGRITGLLTDPIGQYSFTVRANEPNIIQTFIFTISNDPPEPYWSTLSGWVGNTIKDQFFSFQFKSNGSTYAVDPLTPLPAGLSLTSTGFLSGVPVTTTIGNIEFNIIVDNTVKRSFFIRSNVVFDISFLDLTTQVDQNISLTIDQDEISYLKIPNTGIGNIQTFEIVDGNLPSGLTIQNNTGLLLGKSNESGIFTFTVEVQNNFGTKILYFVSLTVKPNVISGKKLSIPLLQENKRLVHNIITSYIPYNTIFRPSDINFGLNKYSNIDLFQYTNMSSDEVYEMFKDKIGISAHGNKFKLLPVQNNEGNKICETVVLLFKDSNEIPSNNKTLSMNSIKNELISNNKVPSTIFFNWQTNEYTYDGNNLLINDHDIETGQVVMFKNQGLQPPLQNNIAYYAIKIDNDRLRLARTRSFAFDNIAIDINIPDTPTGLLHVRYNAIPIIYCKTGLGSISLRHLQSLNINVNDITFNTTNLILDDEMIMLDGNFPRRL